MTSPLGLPVSLTEIKDSVETRAPRDKGGEGTLRCIRFKDGVAVVARFPDKVKEEKACPN